MHPPCFDSDALFEAYMEGLDKAKIPGATFCYDCTPEYQREMTEEGRCEHPGTQFVQVKSPWDEDTLQGIRPSSGSA